MNVATAAPELLERDRELEEVAAALSGALDGAGRLLLAEGPAGVGKTRLLEAAGAAGTARGFDVLWARAAELERELPFGIARQLFEAPLRHLDDRERAAALDGAAAPAAAMLGEAVRAQPSEAALAVAHGLYWLAAAMASRRPLLLLVDDAHWADRPSLGALAYLGRRVGELPLVVCVACRGDEPTAISELAALGEEAAAVLRPPPLSAAAVAELTRTELPAASDELCLVCHRITGGNPYLVRAAARHARELGVDAGDARALESLAPDGVARVVLRRAERLGPAAVALAQALAIFEEAPLRLAAALAGLGEAEAGRAADSLAAAGVLATRVPLRFEHPIVHNALHGRISPAARDLAHRRAACLLAEAGADPALVGSHLLQCEPAADEWALEALTAAGGLALERGAPDSAVRLLRRALAEAGPDPPGPLLLALGRAEAASGDPGARERLAAALAAVREPADRALALAALGEARFVAGDLAGAVAAMRGGLAELATDPGEPLEVGLFLGFVVLGRAYAPAAREAHELLERRPRLPAGALGERARLAALSYDRFLRGAPAAEVREAGAAALDGGELLAAGGTMTQAFFLTTWALAGVDAYEPAEAALERAFEHATRTGSVITYGLACHHRLWSRWRRGAIPEALADAEAALELAGRGWHLTRAGAQWARAECLIELGDLEGAERALQQATEPPERLRDSCVAAWPLAGRSRLELARGRPERALEAALRCGELLDGLLAGNPALAQWRSRAALAAAALGDGDRAGELWREELELARGCGAPRAVAIALRAGALVERDPELLVEAVAALDGSPARLERARCLVELGAALRRERRPRDAREPLRDGLELAFDAGAVALAVRARDELLASGGRPRRPRRRGRDALTPRELSVAELAARGLTNPEIAQSLFISRKTVEAHLRHAFRKLDVNSREELGRTLEN